MQAVYTKNKAGQLIHPGMVHTPKAAWTAIRTAVATVDWPTTGGNTYDPPDDVAERFVAYMVDTDEAALTPITFDESSELNNLELRAHFNDNAGTATMQIFAARVDELSVKMIMEVAWVAGTQTTAITSARYFAKTAVVTKYWARDVYESDDESNTGIATIAFDMQGHERFWIGFDTIKASDNVTVEYAGY